jgi:NAD(P)-dependent dehydrogenase (short-subunit alcohol dehydrogenase family)
LLTNTLGTAVITGGASGIGLATFVELLERGWKVVVADRNPDSMEQAEKALSRFEGRLRFIACDISNEEQVAALFVAAAEGFGSIKGLVHAAGVGLESPFLDTSVEAFRRIVDINLTGAFIVGRAAARQMVASGGGAIVNVASASGIVGNAGRAAYGASKGGLITLTKVMAVELAAQGIRVNAVAPGAIETPMVTTMHSPATRAGLLARIPQGRYGTPSEVATVIAALLDDSQMGYCTGQVIGIDGGLATVGLMPPTAH